MVFFCGGVVGDSRFDFAGERAEVDFSIVELNSGFPFSLGPVPFEAFEF